MLKLDRIEYAPYGETWVEESKDSNDYINFKFSGKEQDDETGLYYFGARYYSNQMSRWMSTDPILEKYLPTPNDNEEENGNEKLPGCGGIFEPLNLNQYCYTQNNPIKYIDPDGNSTLGDIGAFLFGPYFGRSNPGFAPVGKNGDPIQLPNLKEYGFNVNYSNVSVYDFHEGLDYQVPIGTDIKSYINGTVVKKGSSNRGYGLYIVVQDSFDKSKFYLIAHLSKTFVEKGDKVKFGQIVAKSGNSGTTGAHAHDSVFKVKSKNKKDLNLGLPNKTTKAVNPLNHWEKWKGDKKK